MCAFGGGGTGGGVRRGVGVISAGAIDAGARGVWKTRAGVRRACGFHVSLMHLLTEPSSAWGTSPRGNCRCHCVLPLFLAILAAASVLRLLSPVAFFTRSLPLTCHHTHFLSRATTRAPALMRCCSHAAACALPHALYQLRIVAHAVRLAHFLTHVRTRCRVCVQEPAQRCSPYHLVSATAGMIQLEDVAKGCVRALRGSSPRIPTSTPDSLT